MADFTDHTGRRYGRWTIVHPIYAGGEPGPNGGLRGYRGKWLVRCDCGRTFERNISPIINGKSRGCTGCMISRRKKQQHESFLQARQMRMGRS